jgi:hypothetical protein
MQNPDASYLRVLSILHYVWGGLILLCSCFAIIYIVMGVAIAAGTLPMNAPRQPAGPPPQMLGGIMIACGSGGMLLGFTMGILSIVSGRRIMQRRSRIFSIVIASIFCISFPLGTALGVFTIIMLVKDSVKSLYNEGQYIS